MDKNKKYDASFFEQCYFRKRGKYPEVSHRVNLERLLNKGVWRIHEFLAGDNASVVYEDCDVTDFLSDLEIHYIRGGGGDIKYTVSLVN